MNPRWIFSMAPWAVLGAVLVTVGWFGWGVAFWVLAIALGQAPFLADVWAKYRQQGANERSLFAAFVSCLRQSA